MNSIPALRPYCSSPSGSRGGRTVLVVDDSAPICDLVAWHLSVIGFPVITTNDPLEAQDIIRSAAGAGIALLLTDMEMPNMSGNELADWCTQARPAIKVVYMSADPKSLRGKGAAVCLEKPFSLAKLSGAIQDALAPRQAREPQRAPAA